MKQYIATFFTHFDAMQFTKSLQKQNIKVLLSPVPRQLSSSCGSCSRFSFDKDPLSLPHLKEIEQMVEVIETEYHMVLDNR